MSETQVGEGAGTERKRKGRGSKPSKRASKKAGVTDGAETASASPEQSEVEQQKPKKPKRPEKSLEQLIEKARGALYKNWIELATQGSFQHLKLLLETFPDLLVNVNPEEKRSLLELLLKQLSSGGESEESATVASLMGMADRSCEAAAQQAG